MSNLGLSNEISYIGNFVTKSFGVEGEIYAIGTNKLVLKNFKYNGLGPAAIFWVGTDGNYPSSSGILLQVELFIESHIHCKCFVCRNRRRLSAITIQKQTLVSSTNICVWLITNIFMLFLSKFSSCICSKIITLYSYYKYLSVILENIFHNFKIFSVFCWIS